ncbi:MAG: HupE/UreJ family protein [Micrococcales bacterium]|nr:HupE/UreJ family protein [Micrococcales bacterium]
MNLRRCLALGLATAALVFSAVSAAAHGFSSVVYVTMTAPEPGVVRTELALEYDLLVYSAASESQDGALYDDGIAAWDSGDFEAQAAAIDQHAVPVLAYVTQRFVVATDDGDCSPRPVGGASVRLRDGVPYVTLVLDHTCPQADAHTLTSTLFGDSEGFVRDTKTIVTYDLDHRSGSAALDGANPSFSTQQSNLQRFGEFFWLGMEHLIGGLDHVLFLLAIIAGSRRLREIVLAATAFTLAHSVTFILAATGLVHVSARIIEPVIALSIAAVAGWHLWQIRAHGLHAAELPGAGAFRLDRAGWVRLAVVFGFGLVHGLGFASALGIDEPWSWQLLWSLLVFNLGLEVVQLGIIAVVFPLLALLRHRSQKAGLWVTGLLAAGVSVMGLVWFVQRLAG